MASILPFPDRPSMHIASVSTAERAKAECTLEAWRNNVITEFQKDTDYWQSQEGQQEQLLVDGLGLGLKLANFQAKDADAFYQRYLAGTAEEAEETVKAFIDALCSQIKYTTLTEVAKLTGVSLLARCYGAAAAPMIVKAIRSRIKEVRYKERMEKYEKWQREMEQSPPALFETPMEEAGNKVAKAVQKKEEIKDTATLLQPGTNQSAGQLIQVTREEMTQLGITTDTHQPVWVSDLDRQSGMYVIGVPGAGKSSFANMLIDQDIKKGHAVIVLDPHGDLIDNAIAKLDSATLKREKVFLLNMEDAEFPFGLNLFGLTPNASVIEQEQMGERALEVFKKCFPDTPTLLLEKYIGNIAPVFFANAHVGYSLTDVRRFLVNDEFRARLLRSEKVDDYIKEFWLEEFAPKSKAKRESDLQSLLNRLNKFTRSPLTRHILGQGKTTIDFRAAIENHEVLLIKLALKTLGEKAKLTGTVLLSQLHAAIFSFQDLPEDERPGFSLYIDEVQNFITPDVEDMYSGGRKYGCRMCVIHQGRDQVPEYLRAATKRARIKISFALSDEDARDMAPVFSGLTQRPSPESIYIDMLDKLEHHPCNAVKEFYRDVVEPIQAVAKLRREEDMWRAHEAQEVLSSLKNLLYYSELKEEPQDTSAFLKAYAQYMGWYARTREEKEREFEQKCTRFMQDRRRLERELGTTKREAVKYRQNKEAYQEALLKRDRDKAALMRERDAQINQLERARDAEVKALKDMYDRRNKERAEEMPRLKREKQDWWTNLSTREQDIVRRGDELIAYYGISQGWGTLDMRIAECQRRTRQEPYLMKLLSPLTISVPWEEYKRLVSKREFINTSQHYLNIDMLSYPRLTSSREEDEDIRKRFERGKEEAQRHYDNKKRELEQEFETAFQPQEPEQIGDKLWQEYRELKDSFFEERYAYSKKRDQAKNRRQREQADFELDNIEYRKESAIEEFLQECGNRASEVSLLRFNLHDYGAMSTPVEALERLEQHQISVQAALGYYLPDEMRERLIKAQPRYLRNYQGTEKYEKNFALTGHSFYGLDCVVYSVVLDFSPPPESVRPLALYLSSQLCYKAIDLAGILEDHQRALNRIEETQQLQNRMEAKLLSVIEALIADPIASEKAELSDSEIAKKIQTLDTRLPDEQVRHTLVKIGDRALFMDTQNPFAFQTASNGMSKAITAHIIDRTRQKYCQPVKEVEREITRRQRMQISDQDGQMREPDTEIETEPEEELGNKTMPRQWVSAWEDGE